MMAMETDSSGSRHCQCHPAAHASLEAPLAPTPCSAELQTMSGEESSSKMCFQHRNMIKSKPFCDKLFHCSQIFCIWKVCRLLNFWAGRWFSRFLPGSGELMDVQSGPSQSNHILTQLGLAITLAKQIIFHILLTSRFHSFYALSFFLSKSTLKPIIQEFLHRPQNQQTPKSVLVF